MFERRNGALQRCQVGLRHVRDVHQRLRFLRHQ
jgi:hypothetical protein